jgi:flagellar hook protein FlgE
MGFRGLFTGVSGLKAQAQKMEIIGNNLANVNTSGYKKDRATFSDIFYQSLGEATKGDGADFGGTNSKDVGLGVQVTSVDTIFQQGTKTETGRTFDFMIEGDDFFVAKNGATGQLMLSRNGAFQLDGDLNVVDTLGNKVQGFNVNRETQIIDAVATSIQIDSGTLAAKATTKVNIKNNIDSSATESLSSSNSNSWELFSGGENFGRMTTSVVGTAGSKNTFGSGFYQDSVNYSDTSATLETGLLTVVLATSPTSLIEGFTVGDNLNLLQGSNQVQRTITTIDTANRRITLSSALPSGFSTTSSITVSNLTDGVSARGTSGTTSIHNDVLRSQIGMVDANGRLLASFYRVSSSPSDYNRATASITGSGGSVTIGSGEFQSVQQLNDLIERTLRDTQLTNYSASTDVNFTLDKLGKATFNGAGLANQFRLVMNATNTEMLDRYTGIAMTDSGTTATTQARVDSSGEIITNPSLALGARNTSSTKQWYDTAGLEDYGYSDSDSATEYGEYAGLRLDGGSSGTGFGVLQLSMTNGLGGTSLAEFKLVARDASASDNEFSTMGELASLLQNTLRSSSFSSLGEDGSLVTDLTANATFTDGRLKFSTSNGNFRNLKLIPTNITADTALGLSRSDNDNFGTVLGELAVGINGKEGVSNAFVDPDINSQTRVYDSQGNEHTAITYFLRDRSSGLTNIEWKYQIGLQPNVNTFSENSPNDKSIYRETFNSITDSSSVRGVVAFDINTGNVLSSTSSSGDARYNSTGAITFLPKTNSLEASTSSVTVDFTGLTSYTGPDTLVGSNLDGYTAGSLIRTATEQNTGIINGVYTNGQTRVLAKIGLMSIDNPEGLQKIGTSYFRQTGNSNSGGTIKSLDSVFSVGATTGTTDSIDSKIHGNSLEASNVDITEELTEMIITQRSYSASGKTITTIDDMVQEALSLKR